MGSGLLVLVSETAISMLLLAAVVIAARISAHSSTLTTTSSSLDLLDRASVPTRPDSPRRQGVSLQPA